MTHSTKKIDAVELSIGIDIGERMSYVFVLTRHGEVLFDRYVKTTVGALRKVLERFADRVARCVCEGGTHSAWIDRLVKALGIESVVANPRATVLRANAESGRKNDRHDAQDLAEWGLNPRYKYFLRPIRHRGKEAQAALSIVRARDALVDTRTKLISEVRSLAKTVEGFRFGKVNSNVFHKTAKELLPDSLKPALSPLITMIKIVTEKIDSYDKKINKLAEKEYPETKYLTQVQGVGTLTALVFILTLEDALRFSRSRRVGPFLGLTRRQFQSAGRNPELRISKCGDGYLRKLLVQCANYILGPFGSDCYLRQFGEHLIAKGGKHAKKRARVAVARKLAVLLHCLWRNEDEYDPMRNARVNPAA